MKAVILTYHSVQISAKSVHVAYFEDSFKIWYGNMYTHQVIKLMPLVVVAGLSDTAVDQEV